jgi:threonine synthase
MEGAIDGTILPFGQIYNTHANRPIWVRYRLDAIAQAVTREQIATRKPSLWRYRELLPLPSDVEPVTLGEGLTPILPCCRLGLRFGLDHLFVKDESQLPTGSFKSRGMTAAVSMAHWLGVKRVAIPTAGNAGGALAAYGARAGMEVFVFMPEDTPIINQIEASLAGAKVFLVNGLINDCGRIVREGVERMKWFDFSTLKEPYRLEGKKTMGLEIAEQFAEQGSAAGTTAPLWDLPDVILYPTGGGTGLIGMWKAFAELKALGWLKSDKMPRLISCQSSGCAPIVTAYQNNERFAPVFPNAHTIASGLRVPVAVGDFMMIDAIRESGGCAMCGDEQRIVEWMRIAASLEGISLCPETAICLDVLEQLIKQGKIGKHERVLVFNTGASQKYPEAVPLSLPKLDLTKPIEYERLVELAG